MLAVSTSLRLDYHQVSVSFSVTDLHCHCVLTAVTERHHGAAPDHPCDPAVRLPDRPRLPHTDDQSGKLLRDLFLHAWRQDAPTDRDATAGLRPVVGVVARLECERLVEGRMLESRER